MTRETIGLAGGLPPTLAQRYASFAASPGVRLPSAALTQRFETYAADTLSVALAGSSAPSSIAAAGALLRAGSTGTASVFGHDCRTTPWDAALVNGTAAHALELDDDHLLAVLHPGAVVVPAAFAVAEDIGADGATFLAGLIAGYEVMCRLGQALKGTQFHHGVHPTALCGVFGAALAASVILGLDEATATRALGIAGTQAAGLTEWRADGSWIKRLHPGKAAHSGVISAYLARSGFTGPATIFDGEAGFLAVFGFGEDLDKDALTEGLGIRFIGAGTAIKFYPCCHFAHGAIDLAISARTSGVEPASVNRIEVSLYRTGVLTYHPVPLNAVDAQFNVPYLVAVALTSGTLSLSDLTEDAVCRPDILDLASRVVVSENADFTSRFPAEYPTEMRVLGAGGDVWAGLSLLPGGDPGTARYRSAPELFRQDALTRAGSLLRETGFGSSAPDLLAACGSLGVASGLDALGEVLRRPSGSPPSPKAFS